MTGMWFTLLVFAIAWMVLSVAIAIGTTKFFDDNDDDNDDNSYWLEDNHE